MKKSLWITSLFALAAMTSQSAVADVKLRGGVANTSYSAEFDGGVYNGAVANADYQAKSFGITFSSADGLYLDLALSNGTGDHDLYTAGPQNFERSDAALIMGKANVNADGSAGTLYFGLKSGETILTARPGLSWTKDTMSAAGFVFGGGLSFPVGGWGGSVGVNGGMGFMGATWEDDAVFYAESDYAFGFSFGLSYTQPFNDSVGMVLDYKGNSYEYTFDAGTSSEFIVTEKTGAFGINLYAKF